MIALFVKIKLPLQNINNISQWIFAFAMTCKNNFGVNNSATFVTKKGNKYNRNTIFINL